MYRVSQKEWHRNFESQLSIKISKFKISLISSKLLNRIEHSFLHNVWNLVDITSPLEILNLDNSIESYYSRLRCRSFWDTLYVTKPATIPFWCCVLWDGISTNISPDPSILTCWLFCSLLPRVILTTFSPGYTFEFVKNQATLWADQAIFCTR